MSDGLSPITIVPAGSIGHSRRKRFSNPGAGFRQSHAQESGDDASLGMMRAPQQAVDMGAVPIQLALHFPVEQKKLPLVVKAAGDARLVGGDQGPPAAAIDGLHGLDRAVDPSRSSTRWV